MSELRIEALSVTQLNDYVKTLMENDPVLSEITVRGEISNFKAHYTGHLYFSLKDSSALVKCVMFAGSASSLRFRPENGMKVVVCGRVSVFPRDGVYQIYVSYMIPDGIGEQFLAFEQLKEKLGAEGLFDESRKKTIPKYPDSIGIVTSATGAAVRDLLNILGRRYPVADVFLYPALVQGSGAAASICRGIGYFETKQKVDVIIIGRGGGSGEDLGCFNDETLARTIAAADTPIISAVGHETDFTISDFVADLRAPTPSAAAELAVPDKETLMRQLCRVEDRCRLLFRQKTDMLESKLKLIASSSVLTSPERSIELRIDEIARLSEKIDSLFSRIVESDEKILASRAAGLEAMSPLSVLGRGYAAVTRKESGEIVTDASHLCVGDSVSIRMRDGTADAVIGKVCITEKN
ncbi:MAG: exodeoxyribonuclease VII large subunit [Clostridia bacterium]|nr:exodeoxyribonuclease VII large subunit [Clostridia bacterium]